MAHSFVLVAMEKQPEHVSFSGGILLNPGSPGGNDDCSTIDKSAFNSKHVDSNEEKVYADLVPSTYNSTLKLLIVQINERKHT